LTYYPQPNERFGTSFKHYRRRLCFAEIRQSHCGLGTGSQSISIFSRLKRSIGTGDGGLREALQSAPPGIFDGPSWAYWNLKYGSFPPPPLPTRKLDD
jgi:hypothetical protein